MKKLNNDGFNTLAVVVSVVAVIILVGIAFYFFRVNQNDSTQDAAAPEQNTTEQTTTPANENLNPDPGYLAITQWGVKAKYDTTQHYRYDIIDNTAYFTTTEIEAADPACKNAAGGIARYSADQKVGETNQTAAEYAKNSPTTSYSMVDDYYYFYAEPENTCNSKAKELQTKASAAVEKLVPNLEKE